MPWHVEKRKGSRPWKIIKDSTGEVVGSSTSREMAVKALRARYAAEGGAKMRNK